MAQIFDPAGFKRMIEVQTQKSVSVALRNIADKACEDLRAEIMSQADALALSLIQQYDIETHADRVIITVKKTM